MNGEIQDTHRERSIVIPRMLTIAVIWVTVAMLISCAPPQPQLPDSTEPFDEDLSTMEGETKKAADVQSVGTILFDEDELDAYDEPKDYSSEYRTQLLELAFAGNVKAMYRLGKTYCCNSTSPNIPHATQWLCKAAHQGSVNAIYSLGTLYSDDHAYQDTTLALAYFEKARTLGHKQALQGKVLMMKRAADSEDINKGIEMAGRYPNISCVIK